jgi:co-chaperonin GroES (HSP10)
LGENGLTTYLVKGGYMSENAVRPVAGQVFVVRDEGQTEMGLRLSASGLLLPEPEKQPTVFRGRLVAVGAQCADVPAPGCMVLFRPWQSVELEVRPGEWVFALPKADLLSVVED